MISKSSLQLHRADAAELLLGATRGRRDEPLTRIYPTCSVCGKPQVFEKDWQRVLSDRNSKIQ